MSRFYISFIKWFFVFLILADFSTVAANEEQYSTESKYTIIQYSNERDLNEFAAKIKGLGVFGFFKKKEKKDRLFLKNKIDEVVERVKVILDMYPLELRFNIVLYSTYKEVEREFRKFSFLSKSPIAFYYHTNRTIFVSVEDITDHILAHEIAHAVISIYFVTPPPAKMQEILAQYVDIHLWDM